MAIEVKGTARRTLITTPIVLLVLAFILIAGGLIVRSFVARSFDVAEQVHHAQALSAEVLKEQLDEETGVRGYAATRDRLYLEPYDAAHAVLGARLTELQSALTALSDASAGVALHDAVAANLEWIETVALPLLHGRPTDSAGLQRQGKVLVDRFRSDIAVIDAALAQQQSDIGKSAQRAIGRVGLFVVLAVVAIFAVAMLFVLQQVKLEGRLEQERLGLEAERRRSAEIHAAYLAEKRIADTLQDAFAQRPLPTLPTVRFSATYVPATDEAKVGGDWYDAVELPSNRILFAVGDVAGHGIDAAVTMNKARQALISSAMLSSDPASILARVNAELFTRDTRMVTAVMGYADARTYEFSYSTAGHPPPLLVEPGRAPRLLQFGSVPLGVIAEPQYRTYTIQSVPGAMLVLYTDGAVEHSRDVILGEEMLLTAAAQAAASPEADSAGVILKSIFSDRAVGDDVAILTICFNQDPAPGLTISAENSQTAFVGRLTGSTSTVPLMLRDAPLTMPRVDWSVKVAS